MKKVPLCLVVIVLLVSSVSHVAAQSDVSGIWVLRTPNTYRDPSGQAQQDGTFRERFFELKQEGEKLTGSFLQGQRPPAINEGTIKDGKIHFVVPTGNPQQPVLVTYDGSVAGDKITLTSSTPGRDPQSGTAERSSREAMLPPKPLPLPELHQVRDNGLARTPPMGWNSWNKFAGRIDDAAVRGVADAMVSSGMKDAGYIYVNIDDTWELGRDANGNMTTNKKFPDMKALADYVHSKGLKIGIYSSPGPKTCAGYEGSYGHEEQDAKQFAAWGFDYLKYDWCSASGPYPNPDAPTMQAVYQKMGDALLKSGRPIVYSLCEYGWQKVWEWGPKVGGNLWRTTGDISDRWPSLDRIGFGAAIQGNLRQFDISSATQPGHFNDPDMLEIGNGGMTGDEYRTHMSLWSLLAAPLLAGNDLRTMTDETKSILMNREVIAVDQDPDGKPPKQLTAADAQQVIVTRPLRGGDVAVGLFNRGDQPKEMSVKWADLGLAKKAKKARDLWQRADVKVAGEAFTATVPNHGVVMLRVSAK